MGNVMRAKFIVNGVVPHKNHEGELVSEELYMSAVSKSEGYESDGLDEDNTFAVFSPAGNLSITIANPALHGKFNVGEKYYMDFTKAE